MAQKLLTLIRQNRRALTGRRRIKMLCADRGGLRYHILNHRIREDITPSVDTLHVLADPFPEAIHEHIPIALIFHIETGADCGTASLFGETLNLIFTRIPDRLLLHGISAHLVRNNLCVTAFPAHTEQTRQRGIVRLHVEIVNPIAVNRYGIRNDAGGGFCLARLLHLLGNHRAPLFPLESAGNVFKRSVLPEVKCFMLHVLIAGQHIPVFVETVKCIAVLKPAALEPLPACREITPPAGALIPTRIGKSSAARGNRLRTGLDRTADNRLGAVNGSRFPV